MDIVTIKGEVYSFDQKTMKISKNGIILTSVQVEPVFSLSDTGEPKFSGILLKDKNSIISLNGKTNPITKTNLL